MKLFSMFGCRLFDSGYGSYLKVDYSINCASEEHSFYETYAIHFSTRSSCGGTDTCSIPAKSD